MKHQSVNLHIRLHTKNWKSDRVKRQRRSSCYHSMNTCTHTHICVYTVHTHTQTHTFMSRDEWLHAQAIPFLPCWWHWQTARQCELNMTVLLLPVGCYMLAQLRRNCRILPWHTHKHIQSHTQSITFSNQNTWSETSGKLSYIQRPSPYTLDGVRCLPKGD